MARTSKTPVPEFTGGTSFSGPEYSEYLEVRRQAMKGYAEGTVDAATKNAARTLVRTARKAIQAAGMTVADWREAEAARVAAEAAEAEAKKAARPRKPRAKKVTETPEPEPQDEGGLVDSNGEQVGPSEYRDQPELDAA